MPRTLPSLRAPGRGLPCDTGADPCTLPPWWLHLQQKIKTRKTAMPFIPEVTRRSTVPGFHLHLPVRLLFGEEVRGHAVTNHCPGNYSGGLPQLLVVFNM